MPLQKEDLLRDPAMNLYFEIEKHFALGGGALTLRDCMRMTHIKSTSTVRAYIRTLILWELVCRHPFTVRTIILNPKHVKHYPPVAWQDTSEVRIGKRKLRFAVRDTVVMWSDRGASIYDGNRVYVRAIDPQNSHGLVYGLSDINEGDPRGWIPEEDLMSVEEFQALVDSHELFIIWKGDMERFHRVNKRWTR